MLFNLDEIGNIHILDLPAALGVGRGRRMTYALGYQNIAQLYHHYGSDGGDAVLGSVGAMIFLPGVDQRTAEFASKRLGMTTVLQSTSVDVHEGNRFDSERTSEVGRPLMDASEIRQMVKYKEAIAVISNAPPVRLTYPKYARLENPPLSSREIKFQQVRSEIGEATESRTVNDSHGHLLQDHTALSTIPKSDISQWSQVSISMDQREVFTRQDGDSKGSNSIEPEYDPSGMDENRSPVFDDGHLDVQERSV